MPPTITQAYPPIPLSELLPLIAAFPAMSLNEKKAVIDRLVGVHPTINFDWGPGSNYRRCRRLQHGERPDHIEQLIWRSDVSAPLGRANPEGFQVIYLADRPDTALNEARVTDSAVVMTDFVIRDGRSIRMASIGELTKVQRTGHGYLSSEVAGTVNSMLNACDYHEVRALLVTDAFLWKCFVGHDSYEVSSHVAVATFRKNPNIRAIAYSSRRQIGAINFAVRVEDFWNAWGILSVRYGHAKLLAMGYFDLVGSMAVNGIHHDGRLEWTDLHHPNGGLLLDPPFFR